MGVVRLFYEGNAVQSHLPVVVDSSTLYQLVFSFHAGEIGYPWANKAATTLTALLFQVDDVEVAQGITQTGHAAGLYR